MIGIAQRYDFTAPNNADWIFNFPTLYPPNTYPSVPWINAQIWQPDSSYRSDPGNSDFVQTIAGGDLYVANPANSPSSFISNSTFLADTEASPPLWLFVEGAAEFTSTTPVNISGWTFRMRVAQGIPGETNPDGTLILATPIISVMTLTSDNSDQHGIALTSTSPGIVAVNLLKTWTKTIPSGIYGYDLVGINGSATQTLFYGIATIVQGATAT